MTRASASPSVTSSHAKAPRQQLDASQLAALGHSIKRWGEELGFQQVGIADCDLSQSAERLQHWLAAERQGDMTYMARYRDKRTCPGELVPGTQRIISVRMDYLPQPQETLMETLDDPTRAFVSRYAVGRDYHKVLRQRLKRLARRIEDSIGPFGHRLFVDSAPVLEKPLAQKAGLGWIGKHTNLLNQRAGSWFFLGELYCDLPLPVDRPAEDHCGRCKACIDACPTDAITAPYQLDARLCISYLTIEHPGSIPEPLRARLGNRIYGCDDCQLACPWNRFARPTSETDFLPRQGLDSATLLRLFSWDEQEFLRRTEGSAIRRIGHLRWLRNIAVALGNGPPSAGVYAALHARADDQRPLVREHVHWAIRALETRDLG